jgi:serpin B
MGDFSTIVRPEPVETFSSQAMAALAEANNAFAADLWGRLPFEEGNLAVSPASISMALAMTWAGARGETADQMAGVLHLEGREGIHEAAATLLNRWDRSAYELRVVNRLFGEQSYHFVEEYLEFVRRRYGAPLECVDFRNEPEPSRVRINAWIEKQTAGRIRDLLSPGAVDALTSLILTNAVYFLGQWVNPFEEYYTHDAPFRAPGGEILVPTMHQTSHLLYCETADLRILEMPYRGGDFAMTILLPSAVDGLEALEKQISARMLDRWRADLRQVSVEVALPRFTIDPAGPIRLASILAGMGMPQAFDQGAADFTGIADPPNHQDRLFIGAVVHKSFVKVDEVGTEAAAATVVEQSFGAYDPPPPRQFRADHPFLFLIRGVPNGMILFMGRVVEPSE